MKLSLCRGGGSTRLAGNHSTSRACVSRVKLFECEQRLGQGSENLNSGYVLILTLS